MMLTERRGEGRPGNSTLEVMGFALHSIETIPGGLWELFIGVWLIVKGFNLKSEE
jgi:hypothetical protein